MRENNHTNFVLVHLQQSTSNTHTHTHTHTLRATERERERERERKRESTRIVAVIVMSFSFFVSCRFPFAQSRTPNPQTTFRSRDVKVRSNTNHNRLLERDVLWSGGGSGAIKAIDESIISRFQSDWIATDDSSAVSFLSNRWRVALEIFSYERARVGLDEDRWFLGWHEKKSYVGKTYLNEEDEMGPARGEIYVSKYALLDDDFSTFIGVLRHELGHAMCGPLEDHGWKWQKACKAIECDEEWVCEANRKFYVRPKTSLMWTKRDGQLFLEGGKDAMFRALPRGCWERTIYDSESNRTVYENADGLKIDPFALKETYEIL